jgi:O-methyltransferase
MIRKILKFLGNSKGENSQDDALPALTDSDCLRCALKFIVNECIYGDYYEFGVFRGQTLISAFHGLKSTVSNRIKAQETIGSNKSAELLRKQILDETIFHAFDSFRGLPRLESEDLYSNDFAEGQFTSTIQELMNLAINYNMPINRLKIYEGWFQESCIRFLQENPTPRKASIIWLDCDLYSSARDCFPLISELLQDGTVLIIDDWFSNKGSPFHGVQKAFYEWIVTKQIHDKFVLTEYKRESWKRISFIINKKPK